MSNKQKVEEKFFLRWINFILFPDYQITDLTDLKDGYILVKLCEVFLDLDEEQTEELAQTNNLINAENTISSTNELSSTKKRKEWAKKNITITYYYCELLGAETKGISAEDILNGKLNTIIDLLANIATAIYVKEVQVQGL